MRPHSTSILSTILGVALAAAPFAFAQAPSAFPLESLRIQGNEQFRSERIIAASPGYLSHELRRCLEKPSRYLLLVRWRTLEDHTEGFRKSSPYQEWKRLLHHFYDPFPTVEHYESV